MWGSAGLFHPLTEDNPQQKNPHVWYEIYFFPGQSKYFDFLLLSLLTPQWHSSALWWQCWRRSKCPSLAWPAPPHVAGSIWLCLSDRGQVWKGESHLPAKFLSQAVDTSFPGLQWRICCWTNWCTHTLSRARAQPLHVASCIRAGTTRLLAISTALQEEEVVSLTCLRTPFSPAVP